MNFDATVTLDGKTATGITVPADVLEQLDGGKRPVVRVSINGHSFSTTIGSMKGVYKIPLSAENRSLAGVVAGDAVRVSVVRESTPVEVVIPSDLAAALAADPAASGFFAGLTASQRKNFVVSVEQAKSAETRARRISKAITALQGGQKRP